MHWSNSDTVIFFKRSTGTDALKCCFIYKLGLYMIKKWNLLIMAAKTLIGLPSKIPFFRIIHFVPVIVEGVEFDIFFKIRQPIHQICTISKARTPVLHHGSLCPFVSHNLNFIAFIRDCAWELIFLWFMLPILIIIEIVMRTPLWVEMSDFPSVVNKSIFKKYQLYQCVQIEITSNFCLNWVGIWVATACCLMRWSCIFFCFLSNLWRPSG